MVELRTVETSKGYSSKDEYRIFNRVSKTFRDIMEAEEYLKGYYGKCKKKKMYGETRSNEDKHIGYIFCFRNSDISHLPVNRWLQQDWVHFYECKDLVLS